MSEAGLRSLVSIVLSSPAVSKVNFKIRGYHVYQEAFSKIKSAVRSERISVVANDAALKGSLASYKYNQNTIILPSNALNSTAISIDLRASIIHECLHAVLDMDRVDTVSPFEEEACAGLTSAIYVLYHTGKHYRRSGSSFFRNGAPVHALAVKVGKNRGMDVSSDSLFEDIYVEAGDIYLAKDSEYGKNTGGHNGI
ncbi:hypothetical protein ASE66_22630 [Bosea sp. Root483D1]|uniref:hypothetical protein n=1 Tax=Bosea sp. Root483D1 TaxID=1736544 RepID=UPI0007093E88|nr:hypothetical protein [Bosea sp. Root483D1]KRE13240.1 hypothetical protein ASE66_22630 [Bosea sp. Root483D1]